MAAQQVSFFRVGVLPGNHGRFNIAHDNITRGTSSLRPQRSHHTIHHPHERRKVHPGGASRVHWGAAPRGQLCDLPAGGRSATAGTGAGGVSGRRARQHHQSQGRHLNMNFSGRLKLSGSPPICYALLSRSIVCDSDGERLLGHHWRRGAEVKPPVAQGGKHLISAMRMSRGMLNRTADISNTAGRTF